jgi:hypothetical protein
MYAGHAFCVMEGPSSHICINIDWMIDWLADLSVDG